MFLYDEDYYMKMDGQNPYTWESAVWRPFFGHVADNIVQKFRPVTTLDIGCAIGLLVDELKKRGVEAYGLDGSKYAAGIAHSHGLLGRVRLDDIVAPLLSLPSRTRYDVVSCIEVVEHIEANFADETIFNICSFAKEHILFSSSPDDFLEASHVNVQPEDYWLRKFEAHGFVKIDRAPWLSKQAIVLRRAGI